MTNLNKMTVALYIGDCFEVMKMMPEGFIDLSIFSPPYNLRNSTGGGFKGRNFKRGKWKNAKLANGYDNHGDDMPHVEYIEWQKNVLREVWRLTASDGAIFFQHKPRIQAGRLQTPLDLIPDELRDYVRQIIIWDRTHGFCFNQSFFVPTHEWIVILAMPAWRKRKGAGGIKDVWQIRPDFGNDHPAPFPVELAQRAIQATDAQMIFDPFVGSGTTGVAALREGRSFIGIDNAEAYILDAAKRLSPELPKGSSPVIYGLRQEIAA